ncbi:Putative acyl-CoA dehydrogenase oxidoreductase, may be related to NAD-dependent histone acetylation [Candidatus Paraburkholderia kirkii UZHbot1]|uniref:Putative acyl-CoA dehydrogenase oxidoreductase, may be related to NAD-dependent histone acetylation n=1 Tax=Candidatus Paraburkholderia kirkii UZHbot1 TaxID=1055526 RepID=G4MCY0_9BURK|nr:Putative acyl-CoA dehydrogenase oxidoreductase, may be related to NAD-dependent histone acetylation [Candidatus Paraburkholderia kirkii UZHbot1]
MDLDYSPAADAFRADIRTWLEANLPCVLRDKVLHHKRLTRDDYTGWHKLLGARGWSAVAWPKEYGGPGWDVTQRHIWDEGCARAGAPIVLPFGVSMVAPVLMKYGSDEQKLRYLPRILDGTDWWCQGYSERGAGSDLASLRTRAERRGDRYVLNGQKTWTTLGQHADMMFCLVRTDPEAKKQEGISFLLMDMKSPGITVRPIITLDEDHEVNAVFFEDVEVPVANLVGEENRGWTYAKYLLGHERTGIARVGQSKRELLFLKRFALDRNKGGKLLLHDPLFAAKVAALEIELLALEVTVQRVVSSEAGGKGPGPEASMLMVEAVGPQAAAFDPAFLEGQRPHSITGDDDAAPLAAYYFNFRKNVDLRRLERDSKEHHRADDSGTLRGGAWTSLSAMNSSSSAMRCATISTGNMHSMHARRSLHRMRASVKRIGARSPSWAFSHCRFPKRRAASMAARSICSS